MILFFFSLIFLISFFTLRPSFNLSLNGDDWLAFFRYIQHLETHSDYGFLEYLLSSYGTQDISMGILFKFFGANSMPYFLISYFLRLLAAFSLYPIAYYLTKNKLASLYSVLFFSITIIGFDTTNWVANMPSYISVTFFNLFLYTFLKSREERGFKLLGFSLLFFYLTYVIAPIRMTGLLPFILIIELFWLAIKHNRETSKKLGLRLGLMAGVFLFISLTGHSSGIANDWSERLNTGITTISTLLSFGLFDFPFYTLIIFGDMIFPASILFLKNGSILEKNLHLFLTVIFFIFLLIHSLLTGRKIAYIIRNIVIGASWLFIIWVISVTNQYFFSNPKNIILLTVGGYTLITAIFLFAKSKNDPDFLNSIFVAISWSFLGFLLPWLWVPYVLYPSFYRYLIPSAVGISLFFAILITNLLKPKTKIIALGLSLTILIIHILATRIYINELLSVRSSQIVDKIWAKLSNISQLKNSKDRLFFYIEGDETNQGILENSIAFGFTYHMEVLYKIDEREERPPGIITEWDELVSAVTTGQTKKNYQLYGKKINPDLIYAYHLEGKDNLIEITDIVRDKLKELALQ